MPLTPESQIGAYTITRELGRGGMGIVYLGHDTRLDRAVAIKALPEHLSGDAGRLERFEREARLLAQLNHPNVAGIYGVEEHAGARYLVLEYVEGRTLGERLEGGALAPDEALDIALQLAAGLEAAHAAGVIHRDLKPGNVVVSPEGEAKILDFGLARSEAAESSSAMSHSPTITQAQHSPTMPGVILGTAAYMSPEQARGRSVDRRTDVWSFGVMLYEMLAGSGPFRGETVAESIGAILHKEVDLDRLPAATPPHVRRVLRRCLQRDKALRYRDIGDVALDMRDTAVDERGTAPAPRAVGPTWLAAAALIVLVGTAGWLLGARGSAIVPPPEAWFESSADISTIGIMRRFALSEDGRSLAYVDDRGRVMVRHLDTPGELVLADVHDARTVFFSPDARWVGYWSQGALRKVPARGGASMSIKRMGPVRAADWGVSGTVVYAGIVGGLHAVPAEGGESRALSRDDGERPLEWINDISFLPSGDEVVYTSPNGVELMELDSGTSRIVLAEAANPRYIASGHLLYARAEGSLWAVPFDPDTGAAMGEARLVQDEPVNVFDVAGDGTLAYLPPKPESRRRLVAVSATGDVEALAVEPAAYQHPRIAPAGRQVAVVVETATRGESGIWILDLQRGVPRHLGARSGWPVWMDAGTRIAHHLYGQSTAGDLVVSPVDGIGEPTTLVPRDRLPVPMSWSEDRKVIAYYDYGAQADVWTIREGEPPRAFAVTEADERSPVLSPDGNWIALVSDETGRDEIHVRSYPDAGTRVIVSTAGGTEPRWAPDGSAVYFRMGAAMMSVKFDPAAPRDIPAPELLFEDPRLAVSAIGRGNPNYDVLPDGRFLMVQHPDGRSGTRLQVVLNWGRRVHGAD